MPQGLVVPCGDRRSVAGSRHAGGGADAGGDGCRSRWRTHGAGCGRGLLQREQARGVREGTRDVYAPRGSSVETVFGIVRNVMGFNSFRLRERTKVRMEWTLVCLAWNVKRLHRLRVPL